MTLHSLALAGELWLAVLLHLQRDTSRRDGDWHCRPRWQQLEPLPVSARSCQSATTRIPWHLQPEPGAVDVRRRLGIGPNFKLATCSLTATVSLGIRLDRKLLPVTSTQPRTRATTL